MALSTIVKKTCPACGKIAKEQGRIDFGDTKLITLGCGHCITESSIAGNESLSYENLISYDASPTCIHVWDKSKCIKCPAKRLMPFQIEGIKFAEKSNARTGIFDEQGLGKTVQALALLRLHPELLPAVIVVKSTLKKQWFRQIQTWTGGKSIEGQGNYLTQVLFTSIERPIPSAFGIYITSYDILKTEGMFDGVEVKTLILDECQTIKNHLAGRSKAVQLLGKQVEHVIALSGTPIKNHAGEYFTILNLLQPSRFPEYNKFIRDDCDSYETQYGYKVGGLANADLFRDKTDDFIIRRLQKDVLPDMPSMDRQFYHVELDKKLNQAYRDGMKELDELMYSEEDENTVTSIIAIMTKLRRITGISKVTECIDYLTDFLLSNDRKIVVFVHHKTVMNLLEANLNKWLSDGGFEPCLVYRAGMDGFNTVKAFRESKSRVMIASTLAAGEGLDQLQEFVSTGIMLERQWNPANEEQAEKRFHRIGQLLPVNIIYMLATETIDEYFTELVEQKRAIVKSTLDNETVEWDTNSLMKELAGVLLSKGKERWRL